MLFARGKYNEQQLQETFSAGSKVIPLANADQYFEPGDDIFVATDVAQQIEYLGQALAVSSTGISVPFVAMNDYPAGSSVWRPATFFRLAVGEELPIRREINTGVVIQRSLGGVVYSARVKEPFRKIFVQIPHFSRATYQSLEQWLGAELDYGLKDFVFVDHQRSVMTCRLLNSELNYAEHQPGYARLELELAICSLPGYV